jgi:hypothetical protein
MTALPEAKLAREAEICYAIIACVTDYDSWQERSEPITIELYNQKQWAAAHKDLEEAAERALAFFGPGPHFLDHRHGLTHHDFPPQCISYRQPRPSVGPEG